jgi:hypothetical protein
MSTTHLTVPPASLAVQLEALNQQQNASNLHADKETVHIESSEIQFQKEQQRQAEERAQAAADDASFWNDVGAIAKDIGAVGAIAGAAFTGGSSLIVAGAILGGSLSLASDVAGRLGLDKKICTGLEAAGAGLSLLTGGASFFVDSAREVSDVAAVGSLAGKSLNGGASAVQGVAHGEQHAKESAENDSKADSVDASARAGHAKDIQDDAFASLQREQNDAKLRTQVAAALEALDQQVVFALTDAIRG